VMGEAGGQLREPVRVETLEGFAGPPVELAAAGRQERRLGDVLGQGVLEGKEALLASRALDQELQPHELP
jgi:hypothetical protein